MTDNIPNLPSDGQLMDAARAGDDAAWAELIRRHGGASRRVVASSDIDIDDRQIDEALEELRFQSPAGGDAADAVSAVRAFRPKAIAHLLDTQLGPSEEDRSFEDAPSFTDREMLAASFSTLPELWQTALWHRHVEEQTTAEIAPLLGRSANESATVVDRAEAGVFEAFLQGESALLIRTGRNEACVPIVPLLGGAARSTLAANQQRMVDAHLTTGSDDGNGCSMCRRRVSVRSHLHTLIPDSIVPGLTTLSVDDYRSLEAGVPIAAGGRGSELLRRAAAVVTIFAVLSAAALAVLLADDPDDEVVVATSDVQISDPTNPTDPTAPSTSPPDGSSSSVPTTTELLLRPGVSGPANTVELVFARTNDSLEVTPVPGELSVGLSSVAPAFAGGSATIDIAIANSGDTPIPADFTINAPRGVLLDRVVEGNAVCVDPVDESASCALTVEPGGAETVALRFSLSSATTGRFVVGTDTGAEQLEVAIAATPRLVHSSVGRGDLIMIGNTLMSCSDADPDCAAARLGNGDKVNRWDISTEFVGVNPAFGWQNSSSATLDLDGANVTNAYLVWSGDRSQDGVSIADDGTDTQLTIQVPGADLPAFVNAETVRNGDVDATQYFGVTDVTDLVVAAGSGDYTVGNVKSVEVQGSYAAWSLIVITDDASAPRRQFVVTSPFEWFSPDDTYMSNLPVPVATGHSATLDVLAFEGERSFTPETLTVGGTVLGGDGAFDSSISGDRTPSYDNNFGVDIDAYDLVIDAPTGILTINASSGKDGVRLAVLGLAVDIE